MFLDVCLDRIDEILKMELELLKEGKFSQDIKLKIGSLFKKVTDLPKGTIAYIDAIFNELDSYKTAMIKEKKLLIDNIFKLLWKMEYVFFVQGKIQPPKVSNVDWDMEIKFLKGVGPKRETYLNRLGIYTLWDLINYFPKDYEDVREPIKIRDLYVGQKAMIYGEVKDFRYKNSKGYRIYEAVISDGTGTVVATWFNQDYVKNILSRGFKAYFYATVKRFRSYWTMNSPTFNTNPEASMGIFPIYHLTEGITQKYMRFIMKTAYNTYFDYIPDVLPDLLIKKRFILPKNLSIKSIHFPQDLIILKRAKKSLAYEEMFLFQLSVMKSKLLKEGKNGIRKVFTTKLSKKFLDSEKIKLTKSQKSVLRDIREDMKSNRAMNRLIQGDVGCGKTLVAEIAMIYNYEAGYQSALMSPTVILAKQHYENIKSHFEKLGIKVSILYGGQTKKAKDNLKTLIKKGDVDVVIGTHALIQEDVQFSKLGLVVVDEQHKFGVEQRASLISKSELTDVIVMTATPIPRTLSMALFGDIDVSTITDMPFGKKDITTLIVNQSKRDELYEFLESQLSQGRKVFFVYPLVEDSKSLDLRSATNMHEYLLKRFSDFKVGLLHGKMKDEEKIETTHKFKTGEYNVLVATTVVEVGIDISDADVIVIEHAERFGLSQLHQLRGRVGRKGQKSYCILIPTEKPTKALEFFKNNLDGFKIADYDLKVRGPGEFMGVKQHGFDNFKMIDITRDVNIIRTAQHDAYELLKSDSTLEKYPNLKFEFQRKYNRALFYAEIG